jgi:hypothetical protein
MSYPPRHPFFWIMIRKNRFRPCDVCRSRKTRCHPREEGSCEYCTLHRKQCTFNQASATRRRASESNTTVLMFNEEASAGAETPRLGVMSRPTTVGTPLTMGQPVGLEASSLGFSQHRFAELYGLSSDMEPILMVRLAGAEAPRILTDKYHSVIDHTTGSIRNIALTLIAFAECSIKTTVARHIR